VAADEEELKAAAVLLGGYTNGIDIIVPQPSPLASCGNCRFHHHPTVCVHFVSDNYGVPKGRDCFTAGCSWKKIEWPPAKKK